MIPINTPDGLFHAGNPATGTPGTVITAEWLNAVQADLLAITGTTRTVDADHAIGADDGIVFGDTNAADITGTLLATAGLVAGKRFVLKNIGANTYAVITADATTIDGELQLDLAPGQKETICFDGTNWQSI